MIMNSQQHVLDDPILNEHVLNKHALNWASDTDQYSCEYYFLKGISAAASTAEMSELYYIGADKINSSKPAVADVDTDGFDVNLIRNDFPILNKHINGKPLIWFDNAATTQKPRCVIDALNKYYSEYNSNVHRGAHTLSHIATEAYEDARKKVQAFIGASKQEEEPVAPSGRMASHIIAKSGATQDDEIDASDLRPEGSAESKQKENKAAANSCDGKTGLPSASITRRATENSKIKGKVIEVRQVTLSPEGRSLRGEEMMYIQV